MRQGSVWARAMQDRKARRTKAIKAEPVAEAPAKALPGIAAIGGSSLTTRAYERLRDSLMTGRLHPGDRLPFREVAQRLGVSVTPAREALLQLVAEKVLAVELPSGAISVPTWTCDDYMQLRELRVLLECEAAAHATKHATASLVLKLRRLHDRMVEAERDEDAEEGLLNHQAFHFTIYEAAKLPTLYGLIENLWLRVGPLNYFTFRDPKRSAFDSHDEESGSQRRHEHLTIIDALAQRDRVAIRFSLERDIRHGDAAIVAALRETPEPGRSTD